METNINNLEHFFGSWHMVELIGEGSFGKVYKIKRDTFGKEQFSALKVIRIPQNDAELKQAYNEGMDDVSVTSYFESIVKNVASEINMMVRFKGNTNIVSYEDHQIIPNENGIGATILIRMELLKSLNDLINSASLLPKDVIRLGVDICKALEKCHANHVIHRDIKPENIFVNEDGDFKLGDFGIARQLEKTMSGLSKKGTYTYMAPEVYLGKAYNATVDLYSLGIVMYRLLNNNRTPFLPAYPAPISFNEKSDAQNKRMAGEAIPAPVNADSRLAQIVLKACAFNPAERFKNPAQMREALMSLAVSGVNAAQPVITATTTDKMNETVILETACAVARAEEVANVSGTTAEFVHNDKTESAFGSTQSLAADEATASTSNTADSSSATNGAKVPTAKVKSKSKTWFISSAAAVVLIAVISIVIVSYTHEKKYITDEQNETKTTAEETVNVSAIIGANVKDIVTYGSYEQDNNLNNGPEPIEWRVLSVGNGRTLLLSEKILDCKPYNDTDTAVTWKTCSLRNWLNNDFYFTAFSTAEQKRIIATDNVNEEDPEDGIDGGENTNDKIYLLSKSEVANKRNDFQSDSDLFELTFAEGTEIARKNGLATYRASSLSDWWLRSPGSSQFRASIVDHFGNIIYDREISHNSFGVRPALLIDLSS